MSAYNRESPETLLNVILNGSAGAAVVAESAAPAPVAFEAVQSVYMMQNLEKDQKSAKKKEEDKQKEAEERKKMETE